MFRTLLSIFGSIAAFGVSLAAQNTISIAEARNLGVGATVTVRGRVTSGPELGRIRYFQDGTAGLCAFPGSGSVPGFEDAVKAGDSIQVSGPLISFNGLLEISPITDYQVLAGGLPMPSPRIVTLSEIEEGLYQSELVKVDCINLPDGQTQFNIAGTYLIKDQNGTSGRIFMRNGHPMLGTTIPPGALRIRAIVSQFNEKQLLLRSVADLSPSACLSLISPPRQSNIQPNGFNISWTANQEVQAWLRYGLSPDNLTEEISLSGYQATHQVSLSGLNPGEIYYVQAISVKNADTIRSAPTPFATASLSSGQIKVFFNFPINAGIVGAKQAAGTTPQALIAEIIKRIDSAQYAIDVAMYNNNRTDLTNALKMAHSRGVQVRYIAAFNASNPALDPPPAFPVIYGNVQQLMHNKFVVIDADHADLAWVLSGSTNWSTSNLNQDPNNAVWIQDQSLAKAYRIEFEEMWGSAGAQPNPALSRFGNAKKDNTPHDFVIGGVPTQLYFSPSDRVTQRIVETIDQTQFEALFALLTFTKDEPAQALVARKQAGASVRGIMDNPNDQGSEFAYLNAQGVPVLHHSLSGSLHHKYLTTDATAPSARVLTGSHNWSQTAELSNDENTLIFADQQIALLYKAEFEARWAELGGVSAGEAYEIRDLNAYPNPALDMLWVKNMPPGAHWRLSASDGRALSEGSAEGSPDTHPIRLHGLLPGVYFLNVRSEYGARTIPFLKL
ncbi:MAG: phospholipase D-like domain-containing protein [Saprospiraceae bacterium]